MMMRSLSPPAKVPVMGFATTVFVTVVMAISSQLPALAQEDKMDEKDRAGAFAELVATLGHGKFKERQQADQRIRLVMKEHFSTDKDAYLDHYFRRGAPFHDADPEVSIRLGEIIREAAMRHQFDRTNRGFIGITLMSDHFFDAQTNKIAAIRVSSVYPDTPGAEAGLQTNDMIVAVDGRRIEPWMKNQDFIDYVQGKSPGDPLKLHLPRDGKLIEINLKLGQKPKQAGIVTRSPYYYTAPDPKEWVEKWLEAERITREKNGFFSKGKAAEPR